MSTPGAFHNADERYDPPKCHPCTREAILQEIMDWINDNDRLTRFLWLYGPAGAGKSAIEQTIAELCHQMKLLAASFFFARSVYGRNNKAFLIASVSHGCDKPQGDTGRGMEGWGQGMKKSTRDKPQPLWRVHG